MTVFLGGVVACLLLGSLPVAHAIEQTNELYAVTSPNGRVQVNVTNDQSGLRYSVLLDHQTVIAHSPLGLLIDNTPVGNTKLALVGENTEQVQDIYKPVVGKTNTVQDYYNVMTLQFSAHGNRAINIDVAVRAYDGGVAFRYELPDQDGLKTFTIQDELTRFDFPKDYSCFGFNVGKYENSHEGEFDPIQASLIREHTLYDTPLVCKTGVKQTTFALAEANVRDYPGSFFRGRGDGGLGVGVKLTPRFDSRKDGLNPSAVHATMSAAGVRSPWRVIMLGDTPGALTQSSLISTLGEPTQLKNTEWIKPGKSAWDWWNDHRVVLSEAAQKAGIEPGMNTDTYKAYIDFAATLGLEYILVDSGWYEGTAWTNTPGADVTKPIPDMDMAEIIQYAKDNNVGVWIWLQWRQLDWQMEQALSTYETWGIKGIKVDFMNRSDQEMVGYYHKLLKMAGDHHIMVDLHGAYAPNGLARTYPHYMTQEGVLGAEYNKWSRRITATHNVTLPFTRMILGPIDYTPGGFRHTTPEEFPSVRRNTLPYVQTTRGQALAMYVVFDSPLQMLADSPITYSKIDGVWPQPESAWQDGLAFIKDVPTTWDETLVLQGDIGEYIVTARRKGAEWYIGAMTNEQARTVDIPLPFLGTGKYTAHILEDGKTVSTLKKTAKRSVRQKDTLTLNLAPSGGAVVHLTER